VAYASDETGGFQIYVRPFPGPGGKWQVSTAGGDRPSWSADGKELYFYNAQSINAASIEASGASLRSGVSRVLFAYQRPTSGPLSLSPDGKRFLLLERQQADETPHVVVVLNALSKQK
jgi:eukaryotic-like serine/threonine-protein kinase